MIQIKFKDEDGNISTQDVDSLYLNVSLEKHRQQGHKILSVKNRQIEVITSRKTKLDIYIFAKELLILLEAGLNIREAIQTFVLKETDTSLKSIYTNILQSLNQGLKLSQAFHAHSNYFPKIFISAIQSSETSGNIRESLRRFITYQHQERLLKSQIKSASIYPIILSAMGVIVTLFLLGYVVPRFSAIYDSSGREIPLLSKLLLSLGGWLSNHQVTVIVAFLLTLVSIFKLTNSKLFQFYLIRHLIKYKYFKQLFEEYYLSKFYRVMGLLIDSGMPLLDAIQLSRTLLHSYYDHKITLAKQQISAGNRLSEAFWSHELAPPVAYSLLKVGEGTGSIAQMFDSSADFYEEKLTYHIQFLMKIIEPLLMIFIGLIIGFVVVLLYLPIFDLAGTVGT